MAEVSEERQERSAAVLSVRFAPEELDELKAQATRAGVPVSAYVRRTALARPTTGLLVSTASNNHSPDPSTGSIEITGYAGPYSSTVGRNR